MVSPWVTERPDSKGGDGGGTVHMYPEKVKIFKIMSHNTMFQVNFSIKRLTINIICGFLSKLKFKKVAFFCDTIMQILENLSTFFVYHLKQKLTFTLFIDLAPTPTCIALT